MKKNKKIFIILICLLLIVLAGIIVFSKTLNPKPFDHQFAKQVEYYIKDKYNMDLKTTDLRYVYYDKGFNSGAHWYFDFTNGKYPDIKIRGFINYIKKPENIILNIIDVEFAKQVQDYLSAKYGTKLEITSLIKNDFYVFGFKCSKYPNVFIEGSSKNKSVKNIVLKNYPGE